MVGAATDVVVPEITTFAPYVPRSGPKDTVSNILAVVVFLHKNTLIFKVPPSATDIELELVTVVVTSCVRVLPAEVVPPIKVGAVAKLSVE